MPPSLRLWIAFLLPLLLLAGCGGDVRGSATPLEAFGAQDTAWLGCPSMQGMYAWPPEAGAYAGRIASNDTPWPGGVPVPIGRGRMQVWVVEGGARLTMLSRDAPADGNTEPGLRRRWAYAEHALLACRSGMLVSDEEDIGGGEEFGCKGVRRSFRLARMEDGALAVGLGRRAYDCTQSVTIWGDKGIDGIKAGDRVIWTWSKLRRIGEGEPPPGMFDG